MSNPPPPDPPDEDTQNAALVAELDLLSQVPGWENVRQNAAAGYYQTVAKTDLATDIRGLTFETPPETAAAEALAVRAAAGEFGGL
jgi:hypothetical protein